jgi:hypothetical protein
MHPTRRFNLGLEMPAVIHQYLSTPITHEVCEPYIYSFINSPIQLLCSGYPRALDASLDSYPMGIAACFGYLA